MGFIPIILFTLAFIFLWGIVNYSSLRKTRNEISRLRERITAISQERRELSTRLLSGISIKEADKDNMATIMKIAESPLINPENIEKNLRQESSRAQLSAELKALTALEATNQHPRELIISLTELTTELAKIHPAMMDLLHNYREMTSKPPSRFIARLFGFQG